MEYFEGEPTYDWARTLLMQIEGGLFTSDSTPVVSFQSNPDLKGIDLFGKLLQAIIKKRVLKIKYAPFGKDSYTERIYPYHLKQFNETYNGADEKLSTLLRQISWTNNLTILSRSKSEAERLFYLQLCVHDRLSFRQLERQIDSALYERNAVGSPKLSAVLREIAPQVEQIFRDQYVMEFIGGKEYEHENSMKAALVKQMKDFVLEFGKDFLFIDEEYRLQVGSSDFRIDLLFYHRELQCLVAFELKMEKFKPEHLGQLNFYLEALDRDVRKPKENPSIGVLLCKDKDDAVVEYALSRSLSPTMVAEYQLCLPDKALLQRKLLEIQESLSESEDNNI